MGTVPPRLTKEVFLSSLPCRARGWYMMNTPATTPSRGDQPRMREGQDVHARARELFADGVFAGDLARTTELLGDVSKSTILEASFETDGCAARADILSRKNDRIC